MTQKNENFSTPRFGFFLPRQSSIKEVDDMCSVEKNVKPTHVQIGDKIITVAEFDILNSENIKTEMEHSNDRFKNT